MTNADSEQIIWRAWGALLTHIGACLAQLGSDGWLVGGCLRDIAAHTQRSASSGVRPLLPWRDVDLAIQGDPLSLAHALELGAMGYALTSPFFLDQLKDRLKRSLEPVRNKRPKAPGFTIIPLTQKTVRIALEPPIFPINAQIDLSRLTACDIAGDLAHRDYTIDALALPLASIVALVESLTRGGRPRLVGLIDPLGGLDDLRARRLRCASPTALRDEPGRILRGARLIADFRLAPSDETRWQAHEAAGLLRIAPLARLRDLVQAILARPHLLPALSFLTSAGALSALTGLRWEDTFALQRLATADTPRQESAPAPTEGAAETGNTMGTFWSCAQLALGLTDVWLGATRRTEGSSAYQSLAALRAALRPVLRSPALSAWFDARFTDDTPRLIAMRWAMLRAALDATLALARQQRERRSEQPHAFGAYSGPVHATPTTPGASCAALFATSNAWTGRGREPGCHMSGEYLPLATREARQLALRVYDALPQASALLASDAHPDILDAPQARLLFDQHGGAAVDMLVAATLLGGAWSGTPAQAGRLARRANALINIYLTNPRRLVPPPLLTGSRLIDTLRLAPGPVVGQLLGAIRAEQLAGRLTTEAEALTFGAVWLRQERISIPHAP